MNSGETEKSSVTYPSVYLSLLGVVFAGLLTPVALQYEGKLRHIKTVVEILSKSHRQADGKMSIEEIGKETEVGRWLKDLQWSL